MKEKDKKYLEGAFKLGAFFIFGAGFSLFFYDRPSVSIDYEKLFLFIGLMMAISSLLLSVKEIKKMVEPLIALSIYFLFVSVVLNTLNSYLPFKNIGSMTNLYLGLLLFGSYLSLIIFSFVINTAILLHLYRIGEYYQKKSFR